jgi:ribonuclease Z
MKKKIILTVLIVLTVAAILFFKKNYYFAGTEELRADEIRMTACGTGMPVANPFQAGTCWLVETKDAGNFLFDIGNQSMERVSKLSFAPDELTKIFITHLHTDHWSDLPSLWVGGWITGRTKPLQVYGPSGPTPELGTAYAIKHMKETYRWDTTSRTGRLNSKPSEIIVHEFDYMNDGGIVYEQDGAKVISFPAVHAMDGPVGYIFEYKGLKIAFTGDNAPNNYTLKHGKGVDVMVHESFLTVDFMVGTFGLPAKTALDVSTKLHTSPQAFGKLMSMLEPRHAVAYHFFNLPITTGGIIDGIRELYDGPLTLADDLMMWNINKDDIRVRKVLWNPLNPPKRGTPLAPNPELAPYPSQTIQDSMIDVSDAEAKMVEAFRKAYLDEEAH